MRTLLIALTLLLIAPEALAGGGDRRDQRRKERPTRVIVADYTSPTWDGFVVQAVADFNAILPKSGPRLKYVRMDQVPCENLQVGTPRGKERKIMVCSGSDPRSPGGQSHGWWEAIRPTRIDLHEGIMSRPEAAGERAIVLCHEMMHALTDIPDNYGAAPDTSCVWGSLSSPGPFDVAYIQDLYPREKKKKRHR